MCRIISLTATIIMCGCVYYCGMKIIDKLFEIIDDTIQDRNEE